VLGGFGNTKPGAGSGAGGTVGVIRTSWPALAAAIPPAVPRHDITTAYRREPAFQDLVPAHERPAESTLSRWYQARFGQGSSRIRRIGIVALARRLLVELWRYLETGVVPAGAVVTA
jgi:hypothetical protein